LLLWRAAALRLQHQPFQRATLPAATTPTPPKQPTHWQVYERAIPAVPKAERMSVVELYVSRATDFFGIAKVRWGGGLANE
jgi:hypothetical protein